MNTAPSPFSAHLLRQISRQRSITEVAAPILVAAYFLLTLQPFSMISPLPGAVLSLLFPAAGVAVLVLTPSERLGRIPVPLALLAYVAWASLSYFWSLSPATTFYVIRAELAPLVVMVALAGTVPPRLLVRIVLWLSVWVCAWSLVASLALPESRESGVVPGESLWEFQGTFGHKNDLGVFAVLALAAALPLLQHKWRRPILFMLAVTVVSTRSATAGSGLLTIAFVWSWMLAISRGRNARDRRLLKAVSVASGLVAVFGVLRLIPVMLAIYDKDVTFSGRTTIWAASFGAIVEQPLIGYGYGGVFGMAPTELTLRLWREIGFPASHSHNGALEVLIDVGVVGLVLVVAFLVSIFRRASGVGRVDQDRPLGQWAVLFLTSLLVMALAEPLLSLTYLGYMAILWVVLAATENARSDGVARQRIDTRIRT